MAPYHNLPELLKPLHPPHHPDHHKHNGHDHPHPRPSLRVTSIGMALLSIYIIMLVTMAVFTLWRVSRKQTRRSSMGIARSREDVEAFRTYGFGSGGGGLRKSLGIAKSREPPQRQASGSGIPNTHLSHEDIADTEETTLLPQSPQMEDEVNTAAPNVAAGRRTADGDAERAERGNAAQVPEGLKSAAARGEGIFA